jgi:transposase InsO family protein
MFERSHLSQENAEQSALPLVGPFECWSVDFIQMPESSFHKYCWILTIIDHCTSWPIAVTMQDATALAIADSLLEHVITPFGLPWEFLTNCGSNFLSGGLTTFLQSSGIEKSNTSGYHPCTNSKNERYNGILEATLFKLNTTGYLAWWEDLLQAALYSTRIHCSDSSKFSPFELTYGIVPCLAIDPAQLTASELACPGEDILRERIRSLNEKRGTALTNVVKRSLANKNTFDGKLPSDLLTFAVGDVVKLQNEAHVKGAP